MVILLILAATIAVVSVGRTQTSLISAATVTVEARVVADSNGCPTAVELWLLGTPDSIAGVEAAMAWDRPDVVHFLETESATPLADSTLSAGDSMASLLLPQGKNAVLDCDGGLLSDWGFRQARLRTATSVKVIAVADFVMAGGATPIPAGGTGMLWRLPVALQPVPRGAPVPDSAILYLEPGQLRFSNKRGDLIDVLPPQLLMLKVAGCPALRSRP